MTELINHLGISNQARLVGRIGPDSTGTDLLLHPLPGEAPGRRFQPVPIEEDTLQATVSPAELSNFQIRLAVQMLRTGTLPRVHAQPPLVGQAPSAADAHWYEPTPAMLDVFGTVAQELNVRGDKLRIIYYQLFRENAPTRLGLPL